MLQIENNRTGKIRLFGGVILLPGTNEIDDNLWGSCCGHPVSVHYLQRGDIVVRGSSPISPASAAESPQFESRTSFDVPDPEPVVVQPVATVVATEVDSDLDVLQIIKIDEMKAREAVAMIAKVDGVETLRLMLQLDARPSVVKAINKRIAALTEGNP